MNTLIEYFGRRRLFADLLTLFVFAVGIGSLFLIRREVFPNINFDIITVATTFPGSSASETEKLITNPLEQDLKEVDGIKKVRSISTEGRSYITLFLDPDQTTEDEAKNDIQDVVDRFTLPSGALEPVVTALNSKYTPLVEVAVSGDIPELELRKTAKYLEDQIEKVRGVARVVPAGLRDLEVRVEADPARLAQYRISLDEVVRALQIQNVSVPAGSIEPRTLSIGDNEKTVRTVGDFKGVEDVKKTVVRANELGNPIRVMDVAKVFESLEKPTVLSRPVGQPGLSLTILKKEKGDAIRVVQGIRARLKELEPTLDKRIQVTFINDFSLIIERRISVLSGNLLLGLVLVMGLLALILPFRVAVLVSLGIPFSFLGTMILFNQWGYSINLISLLGLIIVSGMLVDDAIVVTDNAVRLMEEGMDPEEAAIKGTQQVWAPVFASVMTTILAFAPMLFMSGIFGKFIGEIPLGVIVALGVSLFEAYFILPGHIASYIRVHRAQPGEKRVAKNPLQRFLWWTEHVWDEKVTPAYTSLLEKVLKRRYWVAAGSLLFLVISVALPVSGKMKFILFPPDGVEIFFVRMQAPNGTSLRQTEELVKPIERIVSGLPKNELDNTLTKIGLVQNDPNDPETKRGSEYAQIQVFLTPEANRTRLAADIIEDVRAKIGTPPGFIRVTYDRARPGPPVGKPESLSVRGKSYEEIMPAVEELKRIVAGFKGVNDIQDSYVLGKQELKVNVNSAEASAAGLSVAQIGQTVRAAFDGLIATTIRGLDEEVDVRVSLPESSRKSAETLSAVQIPNPRGNLIPLSRVASISQTQSLAYYEHEGNEREIRVTADINTDLNSPLAVNAELKEILPEVSKKFPGVSVFFGGEDEDTRESFASLGRAFVVAILGIFLTLVFTFGRLGQSLLILLTIPLGIISVIWTLFLHGRPLSFLAMLGIIALGGVIVNNAIILIDFVNVNRAAGQDRWQSILGAAKMRIRPIFLTTATTVAGLLPTAYGIGGIDQFVIPIALALGWGLAVGSLLTAFIFPSAIAILDDIVEKRQELRNRKS